MERHRILLIGGGKMGGALLAGFLRCGLPAKNIVVAEPSADLAPALEKQYGISVISSLSSLPVAFTPDILLFAVKPQVMAEVMASYRAFVQPTMLCISIAAGKTLSFFSKHLGANIPVIRCMPNLPATVGKGVTVACGNPAVTEAQKETALQLLKAVGECHYIQNEGLLDAVTALSGSGPAYVFHFLECLMDAGEKLGLPSPLAKSLAYATVAGSAELAITSPHSASQLREQVTSPKGTTEAALSVLMGKDAMKELMLKALQAASERSKALAE